jgi:hypothetical protein
MGVVVISLIVLPSVPAMAVMCGDQGQHHQVSMLKSNFKNRGQQAGSPNGLYVRDDTISCSEVQTDLLP